ncbi:MAG: hypothetical protein KDB27_12440, partial [Planctomycetales bacterium]|nr:hypothetical protein [Planctomycetales bacterium]
MMSGVLKSITIVLGLAAVPAVGFGNGYDLVGEFDCHLGINAFPGDCCREQYKGLELWSGYCYEKAPPYSSVIVGRSRCTRCAPSPCHGSCQTHGPQVAPGHAQPTDELPQPKPPRANAEPAE